MITEVFLLWHIHELDDSEEDAKLIGVYSSQPLAEAARERCKQLLGFSKSPQGFHIDKYELDKDHWTEGYITVGRRKNS